MPSPPPPPPSTPASSTPNSLTNPPPGPSLCLTPPTQRRHQSRLARCANIHARSGSSAETNGETVQERRGYAAEEVETRRQERRREEEERSRSRWGGWEREAEGYEGERFVGLLLAGGGGVGAEEAGAAPEGLRLGAEQGGGGGGGEPYGAWLNGDGLDYSPFTAIGAGWQPSTLGLGAGNGLSALTSGQTLPLVLGALYLLLRACGVGERRGARREVQGKGKVVQGRRRA